ncbi:MAG: amino acid racemase [bacterium]|nr:amino acid racemase [bacterium]
MPKRIGILGGISHESTAEYYNLLHRMFFKRHKDYYYPEIVIYSLDFQKFTDLENKEDKSEYIEYISLGIKALERAGAEFVLMAANSPHSVYNEVESSAGVPMISIVDAAIKNANDRGLKNLLLLGIEVTMRSSFYQNSGKKLGINITVPSDEDIDVVNTIIFDELVLGNILQSSRNILHKIIAKHNVHGVILGCTELPLILRPEDSAIPLLSTTLLHVEAALDHALSG